MQLRVGRLDASGVHSVQKINKEVLPYSPSSSYYDRLAAYPKLSAVVYARSDVPIGAITCRLLPERTDALYIATLAVLEPFQNKGAGRMLVRHAYTLAEGMDLQFVDVHVWTESYVACRFYERLGFYEISRISEYYTSLNPPSAVLMRKNLNESCVEW